MANYHLEQNYPDKENRLCICYFNLVGNKDIIFPFLNKHYEITDRNPRRSGNPSDGLGY